MISTTTLIGRLGRDPDQRGKNGTHLAVATERSRKVVDQWETKTTWHRVVAHGYAAEAAGKLKKGNLVYVQGHNESRKYTDKEGVEREITEVIADKVRSLEPRRS